MAVVMAVDFKEDVNNNRIQLLTAKDYQIKNYGNKI